MDPTTLQRRVRRHRNQTAQDGSVEQISIQINFECNKDLFEKLPSIAVETGAWGPKPNN
jgi:hypothetical protein